MFKDFFFFGGGGGVLLTYFYSAFNHLTQMSNLGPP